MKTLSCRIQRFAEPIFARFWPFLWRPVQYDCEERFQPIPRDLYEYLQNKNFNAADNLSAVDGTPLHPRFDNNRFGGNVGSPILKNKLFFFVDYEYDPVGEAYGFGGFALYAPTAAGYATLASTPGINQTNLAILQKYLPAATTAVPAASTPYGSYPLISTLAAGPEYVQANTRRASQVHPFRLAKSPRDASYTNNEAGVASVDYNLSEKDSLCVVASY